MRRRDQLRHMLDLVCAMWDDPLVYCYQDYYKPVPSGVKSVFLIGPSSRDDVLEFKWRIFAHHFLRTVGFTGVIVIPEPREDDWSFKETFPMPIVAHEAERILSATLVMAWIPRHPVQLPGRVTGLETGVLAGMAFADPGRFKDRLIWGYPPDAWKTKADHHWIGNVAGIQPFHDLKEMCEFAHKHLLTV